MVREEDFCDMLGPGAHVLNTVVLRTEYVDKSTLRGILSAFLFSEASRLTKLILDTQIFTNEPPGMVTSKHLTCLVGKYRWDSSLDTVFVERTSKLRMLAACLNDDCWP